MLKRRSLSVLVSALLLAGRFILLRPSFLGGPAAYIIVSGRSMEPTLRSGDLAILRKRPAYGVGDIVAYPVHGGVVIHRIVGGNATDGFITQGDNRKEPDSWRPKPDQVLGKQWLRIPGGGRVLRSCRQPRSFALLVGGLTTFALLSGGPKRRRRRRGGDLTP